MVHIRLEHQLWLFIFRICGQVNNDAVRGTRGDESGFVTLFCSEVNNLGAIRGNDRLCGTNVRSENSACRHQPTTALGEESTELGLREPGSSARVKSDESIQHSLKAPSWAFVSRYGCEKLGRTFSGNDQKNWTYRNASGNHPPSITPAWNVNGF
jgi:hypothetical protein